MTRLFFDYSVNWSGTPTGIPRVVENLAKSFLNISKEIKLIEFNDELEGFKLLDATTNTSDDLIKFQSGDILFSCGANWAYKNYNKCLKKATSNGLKFSQLFYDVIPWKLLFTISTRLLRPEGLLTFKVAFINSEASTNKSPN